MREQPGDGSSIFVLRGDERGKEKLCEEEGFSNQGMIHGLSAQL